MKKGGFRFKSQLVYIAISNILFVASVGSAKAIEKQFVTSVVDQHVELAAPIEFHIKNSSNAVQNSTITINNEDAWVFFDNVRPQDVITNYASSIHIGAGVLNPGTNGRVAIYAHGTVVMPYGAGFKPLTVYKEDNFTGDSTSMAVQTYYNSLGNFDNAIHSFKLKRGYMATFANNSDGTGYSRVYIADNEDLNISELPPELDGKISFIRVFNYQWVTKKGWCQTGSSAKTSADKTNSTWYYSWSADQTSTSNLEYSVIKQNWSWPGWNEINNKQDISHLLGYNEPDHTEQSNIAVDDAVAQWPEFLKSGLRVGAPATTNFGWLYDFIDQCDARNYRVDYVAIHAYWGGKSPQSWYNDLKYIHERTGRPIWITEWNNGANWTNESWPDSNHALTDANATKQLNDLKGILQVLDTTSFIERYSIYNWVQDCRAIILNGNLTPAGEYYANDTSTIAFTHKNEVIPHWNNAANPKLSLEFLAATRQIKLTWNDPNGELASR
ncbi:MAG TPA: glycosyl hydrolase, partial [Sunxiuqinia sp.]|nr:glycosyl hydrolase [Sunxiuqinia sp.]